MPTPRLADRIELRPVAELVPYARNPRTHSARQVAQVAASIREFGFTNPVLVDEKGGIIAGHARVLAAVELGLDHVPTIELGYLSAAQRRAYVIADNQLALNAGWDMELLKLELGDLKLDGFDLSLAGFDDFDLAGILDKTEGLTDPDDVPAVPEHPVSRMGDLWLLGRHRMLCGDSTVATDVERVMDGRAADLCFTSPPYAQQRDYKTGSQDWDSLMRGVFSSLLPKPDAQLLVNLGLVHRDGEWLPYWDGWIEWMRSVGWRRFGWYVWDKLAGLPGDWAGRLAPAHEWLFHFNREALRPRKTKEKKPSSVEFNSHGTGLRHPNGSMSGVSNRAASLQTHKIPDSVFRVVPHKARGGPNASHPAMFPTALAEEVLSAFSDPTNDIYEPFSGSGTTIIAAEMTGRICHAIEIAPAYVDVAVARWQDFTGKQATLERDDRTFDEVATQRSSEDMASG